MNCPRCSESQSLERELHCSFDRYTCNRCGTAWDVWMPQTPLPAARKRPLVKGKEFDGKAYDLQQLSYHQADLHDPHSQRKEGAAEQRPQTERLPQANAPKGPDLR